MVKIKTTKTILLGTCLSFIISFSPTVDSYAATYTAVSGDSLYKISRLFNTTISNLMKDNRLTDSTLNIGQILYVPCNTYTVQKGDTLFLIAQKHKISLDTLRRANNIYTNTINIGQILNVPVFPISTPPITSTSQVTTVAESPSGSGSPTVSRSMTEPRDTIKSSAPAAEPSTPVSEPSKPAATVSVPPSTTSKTPVPVSAPAAPADPAYSAADLDLLARLITAEAQGEPYAAQVAVGAVILNRVESSSWPNTISEVIYQNINGYVQFTPVANGWINKPALPDCIKAAKEALAGSDPTNGAIFYYDTTTTNQWILSKPVSIKIGTMVYAY